MKKRKQGFKNRGFTLVEVLIVIAVIGILSAISVPMFQKWLPNMRLKDAAQDLYGYMQKARLGAVKTNSTWAIKFNPTANTYILYSGYPADNDNEGVISLLGYGSGVKFGHGNATSPISAAFGDEITYVTPVNVATFNSLGTGNAGYVYLEHEKSTTTFAVGSMSSGAIKVKRWLGGAWNQ